jgi:hypothetical protein
MSIPLAPAALALRQWSQFLSLLCKAFFADEDDALFKVPDPQDRYSLFPANIAFHPCSLF